ncbi:MAG: hypothetical protein ORN54_03295 [Cyclobacteriaceae bacterium]|nr:hypothetical protein [Cyclobacteriaceae bacterium]
MNPVVKIGVQVLHEDEFYSITNLLEQPNVEFYSWLRHEYELPKLLSCDILVLFARRHWRYLKFGKPYMLILADFVTDQKAISLTKTRKLSFTGYRYSPNSKFRGFVCGSSELYSTIVKQNIEAAFYQKKYPFSEIFEKLQSNNNPKDPKEIITLINNYKSTASEWKWRKPENSFKAYLYISKRSPKFNFFHYGTPHHQVSFEESNTIQFNARYTIHIKYWGHVCNAVVKSLALGTPVIMDEITFLKGRYKSYVRHEENGLVLKSKDEIVRYLNSEHENQTWIKLKANAVSEARRWHFPYSEIEKLPISKLLAYKND